jgi:DNA-binding HxlR family transcriptional regulator
MASREDQSCSCAATRGWSPDIVRPLVELIAGRWVLAILWALESGSLRRVVLRSRLGPVSDKVLTDTLRRLELHGLVSRTMVASVPVEVDYDLTLVARRLARLFPDLHHFAVQEQGSSLERYLG